MGRPAGRRAFLSRSGGFQRRGDQLQVVDLGFIGQHVRRRIPGDGQVALPTCSPVCAHGTPPKSSFSRPARTLRWVCNRPSRDGARSRYPWQTPHRLQGLQHSSMYGLKAHTGFGHPCKSGGFGEWWEHGWGRSARSVPFRSRRSRGVLRGACHMRDPVEDSCDNAAAETEGEVTCFGRFLPSSS